MFFKVTSYFIFLLSSFYQKKNALQFMTDITSKPIDSLNQKKTILLHYKKHLLNNTKKINITDFGAGSRVFKNNTRKVAQIAKVAGISNKRAFLLIKLTQYFQPKNILEIGTSLGIATTALSIGNPNSEITTLEGCTETAKIAQQQFDKFNFKNINLITGNFKNTLLKTVTNKTYDIIYFDGNHQKKATLDYFNTCLQSIHNNSIFIFDDIYWSKEMKEAWDIIKLHPKVTSTIDTFQWGIVFFKEEVKKEHYTIRV